MQRRRWLQQLLLLVVTMLWWRGNAASCSCSLQNQCQALLYHLQTGTLLEGFQLLPPFPALRAQCASQCTLHPACLSFNFHRDTGSCQLNSRTALGVSLSVDANVDFGQPRICSETEAQECLDVTCPTTGKFVVTTNTDACVIQGCSMETDSLPQSYAWANSSIADASQQRSRDVTLCLPCLFGTNSSGSLSSFRCDQNGRWQEEVACRGPGSCEDVRMCRQGHVDGEYWLYPPAFGGDVRVKVYCLIVDDSATAYVTLTGDNRVMYPRDYQTYGYNCYVTSPQREGGEVVFHKVAVNVTTMRVTGDDYTFAQLLWGGWRQYAVAWDCVFWTYSCAKRGTLRVDLTSTGLIVDPQQVWTQGGHQPKTETFTRSSDNRVLEAVCGGYCGGCRPDGGGVLLLPDPHHTPSLESATALQCSGD